MALRAAGSGRDLPMREAGEGWFEIETDAVRPGEGYAFVLPDGMAVADPAARAQMGDVHGPSRLVDPGEYEWSTGGWRGRPWEETVFYELHVGAFSPEGTFDGVARRLDHLADIGVTAIELMPVAQFGGNRGWGYDGVLLYAPHVAYGGPDGLKRLVDAAHRARADGLPRRRLQPFRAGRELPAPLCARLLPSGAPHALGQRHRLREAAGARLLHRERALLAGGVPASTACASTRSTRSTDQSDEPLLEELARRGPPPHSPGVTCISPPRTTATSSACTSGRPTARSGSTPPNGTTISITPPMSSPPASTTATIGTIARDPVGDLARALATGFVYQGEPSPYRDDAPRGVPSAHLPPTAFVDFLQNHDQVGNRAFNERLAALAEPEIVASLTAVLLLSPHIPLLFMGEEWGETRPVRVSSPIFTASSATSCARAAAASSPSGRIFRREESRELIADPNAESDVRGVEAGLGEARPAGPSRAPDAGPALAGSPPPRHRPRCCRRSGAMPARRNACRRRRSG